MDVALITQQEIVDKEMLSVVGFEVPFDSYRPLLNLSHYFEIQFFGRKSMQMHAINLVLALLSAWLVVHCIARCFFRSIRGGRLRAERFFSCTRCRSKRWPMCRVGGDLLAGLFALLSVALAGRSASENSQRTLRWLFAIAAGVALGASMLSKESNPGLLPWCMVAALLPSDPRSRRCTDWAAAIVAQGRWPLLSYFVFVGSCFQSRVKRILGRFFCS